MCKRIGNSSKNGNAAWREKQKRLKREQEREAPSAKRKAPSAQQKQKWNANRNVKRKQEREAASAKRQQKRDLNAKALVDQLTPEGNIAFNGAVRTWDKEKVCVCVNSQGRKWTIYCFHQALQ